MLKLPPSSARQFGVALLAGFIFASCATRTQVADSPSSALYPKSLADPLEPLNRGVGNVNGALLVTVFTPAGRVYRKVVPEPGRRGINNFSENLGYPRRLVNNVLQGRWGDVRNESRRFLTNSTVGVAGLFDPASKWDIPKSDATFSQTFSKWGWDANSYLMLPLLGPSDGPHLVEAAGDAALLPYPYVSDLRAVSALTTLNDVSGETEFLNRFVQFEGDPYVTSKDVWSFASRERAPNWEIDGKVHLPSLQTLDVATLALEDPEFAAKGKVANVTLSSTGRKMKSSYWLQKERAPVVYIAPGLGAHRLSSNTLTIAENFYQNGYSVVTTTGVFHPNFIENASTAAVPAYPPVDNHDLLTVLAETSQFLEDRYPGRLGQRALVGFSFGGFQTLCLAAQENDPRFGAIDFDRYVAINPPVDLKYGEAVFDEYFNAPLAWPEAERFARVDNTIHKATLFPRLPEDQKNKELFDGIESKYLVGLSFRFVLRDAIYSSQRLFDMGVIKTPLSKWRRQPAYDEIIRYSFDGYLNSFVYPYYAKLGITQRNFDLTANLRSYKRGLSANPKIRIVGNEDDFILSSKDVSWLKSNFNRSQIKLFPTGGHIGNIDEPYFEQALLNSLSGLK